MIARVTKYAGVKLRNEWVRVSHQDSFGQWIIAGGDMPVVKGRTSSHAMSVLEPDAGIDEFTIYEDNDPRIPDWVWVELMKQALTCPDS